MWVQKRNPDYMLCPLYQGYTLESISHRIRSHFCDNLINFINERRVRKTIPKKRVYFIWPRVLTWTLKRDSNIIEQ